MSDRPPAADRDPAAGPGPAAAAALARQLAEAGIVCRVEPRARLAVLVAPPDGLLALADAPTRRLALGFASALGFTHLAVELAPPEGTPECETAAAPQAAGKAPGKGPGDVQAGGSMARATLPRA